MKLVEAMPTFTRWYQRLIDLPRPPYVAFLVACVIATAVVPVAFRLAGSSFASVLVLYLFVPLWLPVVAGDLALLFWSEKQCPFQPSLMLRLLILTLVMKGFYLIFQYRHPSATAHEEVMNEVVIMSLWGAQCVLLLILEPGLRWVLRRRNISVFIAV
ncbi:hypothetical protein [uncultured Gimesia sp.]|uniref:hypothetical protein n=1 Tax=uncultured Gimesia sp. TaxID=1678688 RepID=UPI0030D9D925|tara:strand:- start:5868 stop:6341 length:474 start_codon:yes stop_codon:yes gene_type:complete